jgi:Bacteriophage tail sheath protein
VVAYRTPGVYRVERFPAPPPVLRTGVPAFLGYTTAGKPREPVALELASELEAHVGAPPEVGYLHEAVRLFFANGGRHCVVVSLDDASQPEKAVADALEALEPVDDIDLVCAPDLSRARPPGELPSLPPDPGRVRVLQALVLDHCDRLGSRFALLDSLPNAGQGAVLEQRRGLAGTNGALYYPWVRPLEQTGFTPPCGPVAGVYARTDERVGVHKAPANETLEGIVDLELALGDDQQGELNPYGVNCLRAFPGRGIRVWGARTLSVDPEWRYVNVRRLFLTAARWIDRNLADVAFEIHDPRLWGRIERELTAYFEDLFRRGGLRGDTVEEAFYVKCDAETNPLEGREQGRVVTEIGLAPASPNEFVVVYVVHEAGGTTVTGPVRPG